MIIQGINFNIYKF